MILDSFYTKWFIGPSMDFDVRREIAYTIGARSRERPGFSRNHIVDHVNALPLIKKLNGVENIYLSIAFYDIEERLLGYHYLYYDFDYEEDPELAVRKGLEFANSIKARYGAEPITYLSGRKGLGVVVVLKNYVKWDTYVLLWRTLIQPYDYHKFVDTKVLDPRRVHRIPFTYNIKPGFSRLSRLVDLRGKWIKPDEFSWSNYEPLDPSLVKAFIVEADLPLPKIIRFRGKKERPKKKLPDNIVDLAGSEAIPPCIRNIIESMVRSGDIDHYARLVLVWFLKWIGFSVDDVVGFFRHYARDYDERITRYQVEYAYGLRGSRKDWIMPSCQWMKQHNLCLGCGWNRNPVTYTYTRAEIHHELVEKFFQKVRIRVKEMG